MPMPMTSRERLEAIYRGRVPDRPAVRVWAVAPGMGCLHPALEPIRDLAVATTDLVTGSGSAFDLYAGRFAPALRRRREVPTSDPAWVDVETTWQTPAGELREVYRRSTVGKPGYEREYLLKEPEDIEKLLSLPYEPFAFDPEPYRRADRALGDRGIVVFGLDHPAYGLQRLVGSENFALWTVDAEDLVLTAIATFAERVHAHARAALAAGIRGVYGWVGPELCIPPLLSLRHFDRYCDAFDRPLIATIHEGGGRVWVHCHGKMRGVIERFADQGVDVLNPIEPPPMGDLELPEAFAIVGERMGLEGNLETHDLMTATPEVLRAKLAAAVEAGRGRRFILCPSSGFNENPEPGPTELRNWRLFIEEGLRLLESAAN